MLWYPLNWEIGFVSSSFSFRVVRASGRGESAWACVGDEPPRWASRVPVSTCERPLGTQSLCACTWVLTGFGTLLSGRGAFFVRRHVGFKRLINLLM